MLTPKQTHTHTSTGTHTPTHTPVNPLGLFASVANFKVVNIKLGPSATCRRGEL